MARPGEWILSKESVEINVGRRTCKVKVRNTGDRPVQVGSHYHFFEVNRALDFDRAQALGMHLNIPGGLAIRFEPGDEREVELVEFGGTKRVFGFNNLVDGGLTAESTVQRALRNAQRLGFPNAADSAPNPVTTAERGNQEAQQADAKGAAHAKLRGSKSQGKLERKS